MSRAWGPTLATNPALPVVGYCRSFMSRHGHAMGFKKQLNTLRNSSRVCVADPYLSQAVQSPMISVPPNPSPWQPS